MFGKFGNIYSPHDNKQSIGKVPLGCYYTVVKYEIMRLFTNFSETIYIYIYLYLMRLKSNSSIYRFNRLAFGEFDQ